jgi:hypothetical protein
MYIILFVVRYSLELLTAFHRCHQESVTLDTLVRSQYFE